MYRQDVLVALYARIEGPASAVCALSQAGFGKNPVSVLGPVSPSNRAAWACLRDGWYEGRPASTSTNSSVVILGPLASSATPDGHTAEASSGVPEASDLSRGAMGLLGLPWRAVALYEQALRCDKFVLVVEMPSAESIRAEATIRATVPMRLDAYFASAGTTAIAA